MSPVALNQNNEESGDPFDAIKDNIRNLKIENIFKRIQLLRSSVDGHDGTESGSNNSGNVAVGQNAPEKEEAAHEILQQEIEINKRLYELISVCKNADDVKKFKYFWDLHIATEKAMKLASEMACCMRYLQFLRTEIDDALSEINTIAIEASEETVLPTQNDGVVVDGANANGREDADDGACAIEVPNDTPIMEVVPKFPEFWSDFKQLLEEQLKDCLGSGGIGDNSGVKDAAE